MYDLKGVIAVITVYPVHIMTFVGCMMLFGLVLPRRRRRRKHLSISTEPSTEKRGLTQREKELLAEKIRGSGTANLKKSFAGEDNTMSMVLVTIVLILLFLLWIVWMLPGC